MSDIDASARRAAPEGYRSEEEQAARLGVTVRTLRRWRSIGFGPNITRLGRFIYYAPAAETEFLTKAEQSVELPRGRGRRAA
jgi:hypothetical protein